MKSISHFYHLSTLNTPCLPHSEATGRPVWLSLYYRHPVTELEQWPTAVSLCFFLAVIPSTFSTSALRLSIHLPAPHRSSDWTLPPLRAIIDGGVIVSISLALTLPPGLYYCTVWEMQGMSVSVCVYVCMCSFLHMCKFARMLKLVTVRLCLCKIGFKKKKLKTILTFRLELFCHFE